MKQKPFSDRIMLVAARWHANRLYNAFLRATASATNCQDVLLGKLLARNADSVYGRDRGFDGIHSYADFARQVPIQDYDDLAPYIERVKAGELNALFGSGQKVLMFALTSGTSDRPKYIPVTEDFLNHFRRGWNIFGVKALMDHPGSFLRPIVQVSSPMDESYTSAGIPCGAITGLMAATQKRLVRKYYVCPRRLAYIRDFTSRYYTIMRFSIPRADASFMVTASPATILKLARTADEHREQMVRDIRDGTVSPEMDVAADIRAHLNSKLEPDPATARRLEKLIEKHGALLPKHYWNLSFLANWTGGTMGLYLQHYPYYFGDVPVRDIGLLASEGRMSIPVEDGTPAGILDVVGNFYEFVPAGQIESDSPTTLRSHEVEVGREYFILLTNSAGLYRYNIGDLVRVTGFQGQAPIIEFLNKGTHISSLAGEKLTERQAVLCVENVCREQHIRIDNFVLAPRWDDPPYYLLHVEHNGESGWDPGLLAEWLETALCRHNCEYESKRKSGRLGRVRVSTLPPGTLHRHDLALRRRFRKHSNEQYKHQFLYTRPGQDDGLEAMAPVGGVTANEEVTGDAGR
ncbi:MAG: GH3 auxin-responsive promoter family protein [Phycisphaerales bacterium]|nr:MAG: GH3 auxin-responsive promoter family protein [Phycisphaerales bacterium]